MDRPEIIAVLANEPLLSPQQQSLLTEQLSHVDGEKNESNLPLFQEIKKDLEHFRFLVLDSVRLNNESSDDDSDAINTLFDALESRLDQLESA